MDNNTYQELIIEIESKFIDFISDFVANIYSDGIEIGEDRIIVRSENDIEYVKTAVESLSNTLGDSISVKCTVRTLENRDWMQQYRDSIEPIEVGSFYVRPSWCTPKKDKIEIIIDPALAFGSGHHATTYSCLEAIEKHIKSGDRVLDVGCGSGILGLAAAKLGAVVDLCDTDPVSVESCKKNFELNSERYSDLWEGSINKTEKKYDIVLANIIADVLKAISIPLKDRLKENGILILSGILDKKESIVLDAFGSLELMDRKQKDEWVTLTYKTDKETDG